MRYYIYIFCFSLMGFLQSICAQTDNQDYQITIALEPVYVYAKYPFKNEKQRIEYNKLVRDVRKAYPYARFISQTIIETYQIMETLPEKERQAHLEKVKKNMMETYKPQMKKMTKRQGQILMKLIDRESGSSSYEVVKAMVGSFQAGTYNIVAGLFGNNLKTKYDPKNKDKDIEQIVQYIKQGLYNDQ